MKLREGFHAGANFLPLFRASLRVEDFLAQADGFRRHFDVLVIGTSVVLRRSTCAMMAILRIGIVILVRPNKKGCKRGLAAPVYPQGEFSGATNTCLF